MAELLYRFREWLTVPDAASHLSIAVGEQVTTADVLRLGLDGHLKLSINLVNGASAQFGKIEPRPDDYLADIDHAFSMYPISDNEVFHLGRPEKSDKSMVSGTWRCSLRTARTLRGGFRN